jgi:hypothetical protein
MANCPPIQSGVIDFAYDKMTDGRPIAFNDHAWKDFQAAAIRAELNELVNILDASAPPWCGDKTTAPNVFRREVLNFGTIWYTFILLKGRRFLLVLTGTCEEVDDSNPKVMMARQGDAERRVSQLRLDGTLCH